MKRKRLMKWMVDNDLKNSDIAEKLGITKSHWSCIVHGKSNPSLSLLEKFKTIFNVENALYLFEKES